MNLSKKDRLILINQYEILKKLEPEYEETFDELIEILQEGYKIFYNSSFYIGDEMDEVDSKMVLDILSFYRLVFDYIEENPDDAEIKGHKMGYFHGFDGNHEPECLGFTRFLIEKQNKFTENNETKAKNLQFNSHNPFKNTYKKMVSKWEEFGMKYKLSRDEILEILNVE